ncbi:wax ester/triacylglycerol synthase family O-acyltransferase [Mycolicibacterium sp. CBMA 226]|uniref:wax ester/triacylglycerol synthase family O-acyltransferase n=1 Tax=Mycolicibacterium sp. CBMA 226 TaxID=2606611 RepID=UPI0012DE3F01|nr:wax ester/triacylglycerol synthase family O-acyltransferase [Mycolicibacterium sp. CBMA 226]MUL77796.1 wax ester/triacylglycerol synthase family O-acyltransferase [Mycolicibacterium sp. CBMA 226]
MRRLSSLDAQFLAAEHGNFGAHYSGLAIFETADDTTITAATMRRRVAACIDQLPPLHWKVLTVPLSLDHPVFVRTEVDLDEHIFESTLPVPADEEMLGEAVAGILSKPLDRDKPLWRLDVIHGLPGRTAVVITLHHAAADGIAASEVLAAILDSDGPQPDWALSGQPETEPNPLGLAVRGLASLPVRGVRALKAAPQTLAHLDQVPAVRALPGVQTLTQAVRRDGDAPPLKAPRTRFNVKLSGARTAAFGTVPFGDIKALKAHYGITVNDVVIALCGGALRRRMTATGDLPAGPLVAYIPVSKRSPDAPDRFGNAISSIIAPVPTHLAKPVDRLRFAHQAMTDAKRRTSAAPDTLLSDVNDPIPVPIFGIAARGLMELASSRFTRPPINMVISNVPGSPTEMTCAGAPLLATYPGSLVFDGFALNITVVSYQGGLDIGIVGDAKAVPDGWELLADFRHELDELSALVEKERSAD